MLYLIHSRLPVVQREEAGSYGVGHSHMYIIVSEMNRGFNPGLWSKLTGKYIEALIVFSRI